MGAKGDQTKKLIKNKSYQLFAEKGFQAVTMKDICEVTGLSRGGLYRHYDSTETIFTEIFKEMANLSEKDFKIRMEQNVPAVSILDEILNQLRNEMKDSRNSLSLAIYEYANSVNNSFFEELNQEGIRKWRCLICYGMNRGEFKKVNVDQVIDIILYSYQGVRMWSRVIPIGANTADHIVDTIRELLVAVF
jgi:AcrR family transcriptional regulator